MSAQIILQRPDVIRFCIRCMQPITFDFVAIPIVDNRKDMNQVAVLFAHPDAAACERELDRAEQLDNDGPDPDDIGAMRAALIRTTLREARAAMEQP